MKVPLAQLTAQFKAVLVTSGAPQKDVDVMTALCLEQDLHHNVFSGLDDVQAAIRRLKDSIGKKHKIVVDMPALKLVDCGGRAAGLVTNELLSTLCAMTRSQGIAIIGYYNGGYQSFPGYFARAIAMEDLVGIVAASGNGIPHGVVPFGGSKDVLGTNPLAYGIPADGLPIVFDAATSKYPWRSIALAQERGEVLPERSFLDKHGEWTTNPTDAVAIIPFGEHKGYAINLLLEVLTGTLVRAKSGLLVQDEKDLGGFLIAIDPAAFGPLTTFKAQVAHLAKDIEATKPAEGFTEVRVPGYNGERYKQTAVAEGYIEIDDLTWQKFQAQYDALVKHI